MRLSWLDPILNPLACLPPPPPDTAPRQDADAVLKHLEALLQRQLRHALSGEKRSIIKGQGLDFADLREYSPGDDIRKIDWNVFARTLTPHIREYHEDKQLTIWLVPDVTPSMVFGRRRAKLDLTVDLAGLLGLMAQQSGHKLGALLITGTGAEIIPPKAGYGQLQQIMRRLLDATRQSLPDAPVVGDPLAGACAKLSHLAGKNSTVFMLSDFMADPESWRLPLGRLSRRATLVYLRLYDPVEADLPDALGLVEVYDPETGELACLDGQDAEFRAAYRQAYRERQAITIGQLEKTGRVVSCGTDSQPVECLLQLVRQPAPNRKAAL